MNHNSANYFNPKPVFVLVPVKTTTGARMTGINVFKIVAIEETTENCVRVVTDNQHNFIVEKTFDQMMDEIDEAFEFKIEKPSLEEALAKTTSTHKNQ